MAWTSLTFAYGSVLTSTKMTQMQANFGYGAGSPAPDFTAGLTTTTLSASGAVSGATLSASGTNAVVSARSSVNNGGAGFSELYLGNATTQTRAYISYQHSAELLLFGTSSANRASLSTAGLTVTGSITPSQTGGIVGTTTNNNANAGSVGEYVEGFPSAASMTSNIALDAASISLTAGDWDVSAIGFFIPAASTSITSLYAGISTATGTIQDNRYARHATSAAVLGGADISVTVPPIRISLASTTTIYLVQTASFTVSTLTTGTSTKGGIFARRVR